jgi:hypothetical protein
MLSSTCDDCESLSIAGEADPCPQVWDGGIGSLYTMLRFYAEGFVNVYRRMGSMLKHLQSVRTDELSELDYGYLVNLSNRLSLELSTLNLPISIAMNERLRKHCNEKYFSATLLADINQIFEVVELELKSTIFIQIPQHRQKYYSLSKNELDDNVHLHLSEVISDIEEGAKCFALGRSTACIFHLMRVTERSVQVFGKKLKVRLAHEKNWQNIIDEINKAIKNMNPKTFNRRALQREYAIIASHLFNVKIAWRNPVMHPKASYTEEEADEVLRSVVVFVNHLASIL